LGAGDEQVVAEAVEQDPGWGFAVGAAVVPGDGFPLGDVEVGAECAGEVVAEGFDTGEGKVVGSQDVDRDRGHGGDGTEYVPSAHLVSSRSGAVHGE
jgi:hypothetical protein